VSVVAVNHVNVSVRFTISFPGQSLVPTNLSILDHRSYSETWDAVTHQEILTKSGILNRLRTSNPVTFVLQGYGVAVLTESPAGTHGGAQFAPGAMLGESGLCPAGAFANDTFSFSGWDAGASFGAGAGAPPAASRVAAAARPVLPSA
jgi:hypothetical protein